MEEKNRFQNYIRLLRPYQYVKNLFIFAALFFSFHFFHFHFILITFTGFVIFSFLASSIYVFNDLTDAKEDALHPIKKQRPIANGSISTKQAIILMIVLATISLSTAFFYNIKFFWVLLGYFVMNLAYSIKLKQIPILDIFIISIGFVLRVVAGAVLVNVNISKWIIIITFLLALFLAIAKRRDDVLLLSDGKNSRKNINGYNLEFINASMVLMASIVIMSYILYTVSGEVTHRLHSKYLYITSFFVILGILRYMQITFVENNSGDPTKIVLKDKFLQLAILLWLVSYLIVVFL